MVTDIEKIGKAILDLSYRIHTRFGSGLLEKAYRVILATELKRRGFKVEEEKSGGFTFDGCRYENMFRVDLLVNNRVVVELKSTSRMEKVYAKQCLTYLRLLDLHLGYVINFGMTSLKDGIERIVNNLPESVAPSRELRGLGELGVMQKGSTAVLGESLTQSPRSPQRLRVDGGFEGLERK